MYWQLAQVGRFLFLKHSFRENGFIITVSLELSLWKLQNIPVQSCTTNLWSDRLNSEFAFINKHTTTMLGDYSSLSHPGLLLK